jgi:glycosyltransferase involved in cell wall biosynthesis
MKIAFLCGSLEPGRDGVGDYVRRLAIELIRQGQQAAAIALNDHYVIEEVSTTQQLDADNLTVLRLPANWPASSRFSRAHQWVDAFNPSWVSLQFVPFSFHPKGLPLLMGRYLSRLTKGRQVHLMMHEGWVGAEPRTGLKRCVISQLQKQLINNIIMQIRPAVIHTHLPIYRTRLQRLGWVVLPLPLFSNIPVVPQPSQEIHEPIFRVGIFSQTDTSGPFIDFLVDLAQHLVQRNQLCQVLLIGGEPTKMQVLGTRLEGIASLRGHVRYTGFLDTAQLSAALQSCDLGLTPVPRNGLGKSGSVAAFLAHGIPVAAPYVHHEAIPADIGLFSISLHPAILLHPDTSLYLAAKTAAQAGQSQIQALAIAQQLLADLTKAT